MDFSIALPEWTAAEISKLPACLETVEQRMRTVIRFSRLNFEHDTGGPFAAGVFEETTGRIIAIGVNRVVPSHCSSAHAEIVALSLAQKELGTYDLGCPGVPPIQLVVNWRPCAMCYGAVIWSGVRSLIIAGSDDQLEQITGFDEGPIHPNWQQELACRDISLQDGLLTDEAVRVFRDFQSAGRPVYNGRQG